MSEAAPTSDEEPLMIIVGGDGLARSTAREICRLKGHRVVVLWHADPHFSETVEAVGAAFVVGSPDSSEGLTRAGVDRAIVILALSPDDRLNLNAALRARDTNPRIRIILRQFNRTLAHKIEQNLPDCAVLSLAWHSAATYAACAIDPTCFRGLQFPEPAGPLTGFVRRKAEGDGLAGRTVADAERHLGGRIVAVAGALDVEPERSLPRNAELVVYGEIARLQASGPRPLGRRHRWSRRGWFRRQSQQGPTRRRRPDRIFARLALLALSVFLVGTWHFHDTFGSDWLSSAYFVLTTMTTTGYGDLTPDRSNPADIVAAMVLMLSGITFSGIFIVFGASALTRAQWVSMQGLRPIRRRGHIVVCGAGSIGSNVIDLLLAFRKPLVVVEARPDTAMVELARDLGFDLLTGDASRDTTLGLCNIEAAHSLIALTNVDTLNLEIALGARARNPDLPIVLRIAESGFAASIARHFEFGTTYSAEALAAPAFASLSRFGGARGRVGFADQDFAIDELVLSDDLSRPQQQVIPIAVARNNRFELIHGLDGLKAGDRILYLIPLAPFHEGKDTLAAAADRVSAAESVN